MVLGKTEKCKYTLDNKLKEIGSFLPDSCVIVR